MTRSVNITLRNPLDYQDQITYTIRPAGNQLAQDWIQALKHELECGRLLEKNFCFMGFPKTARTIEYLCAELNQAISTINVSELDYNIAETFTPTNVLDSDFPKNGVNHDLFNRLHNHFERLQGTAWQLSELYKKADYETKYAIRQLNNLCHEMESLILSQRKAITTPEWIRPSQITTFLQATRYELTGEHRTGFAVNGYDRVLGGVYMHWTQIGKTLFEVWRDEGAPRLTDTVCEAITELRYYSGEFDVEWGNTVTLMGDHPWHTYEQIEFRKWLIGNNLDPANPALSLGYLNIGQVELEKSFGTTDYEKIWDILSTHLDIYRIEVDGVSRTYDYCWRDSNYKQQQIEMMKPGYDYSSRW